MLIRRGRGKIDLLLVLELESLGSVAGTVFEYEEAQSDMSRDREGAVGRALRAVRAVGLTRSREAAKPRRKTQRSVFGVRCSVFGEGRRGEARRGRESAGVRFCGTVGGWLHGCCISAVGS